jgi:uncharacterized protein YdeI (YjbR/CyaY-like superfamily)
VSNFKGAVQNPKVDVYLSKAKKWQEELENLRMIILDCHLTEELKGVLQGNRISAE